MVEIICRDGVLRKSATSTDPIEVIHQRKHDIRPAEYAGQAAQDDDVLRHVRGPPKLPRTNRVIRRTDQRCRHSLREPAKIIRLRRTRKLIDVNDKRSRRSSLFFAVSNPAYP